MHLNVIKYAPWSPSKASLAGQCSKAFKYRYILREKGLGQSSVAKIGNAAHRVQELALEGSTTKQAMDAGVKEYDSLTHAERETVKSFSNAVHKFTDKLHKFGVEHPIKELFLEVPLAIDKNYEACDYKDPGAMIRGIADVMLLLEDGQVIIIDHKSGKKHPIKKFSTQLNIYTVMAFAKFPEAAGVQTAINFMAHDADVKWASYRTAEYINSILKPWLGKHLEGKAANLDEFRATITPLCGWCDYRQICEDWTTQQAGRGSTINAEGGSKTT